MDYETSTQWKRMKKVVACLFAILFALAVSTTAFADTLSMNNYTSPSYGGTTRAWRKSMDTAVYIATASATWNSSKSAYTISCQPKIKYGTTLSSQISVPIKITKQLQGRANSSSAWQNFGSAQVQTVSSTNLTNLTAFSYDIPASSAYKDYQWQVVCTFNPSEEYDFIQAAYAATLGRTVDKDGWSSWTGRIENSSLKSYINSALRLVNKSAPQADNTVAAMFIATVMGTGECFQTNSSVGFDTGTNTTIGGTSLRLYGYRRNDASRKAIITAMYRFFFGRNPSTSELNQQAANMASFETTNTDDGVITCVGTSGNVIAIDYPGSITKMANALAGSAECLTYMKSRYPGASGSSSISTFNPNKANVYAANIVVTSSTWSWPKYTVSYNANGGSGAPGSQTKYYGIWLTLSGTKPTRTGYTFQYWTLNSAGSGTRYSPGGSYATNASNTLYAQWKINTYSVSYNANGGTGAPASQTKTYGQTLKLSSTKPTREGYTFTGWNTNANGTGTSYAAGANYTSNSNLTLYAQWKPNTYYITYDLNGGSGNIGKGSGTYGSNVKITDTVPTREGYTFNGWTTTRITNDSQDVGLYHYFPTALCPQSDRGTRDYYKNIKSNVTLYAAWKIATYTITYDTNGGTGQPAASSGKYNTNVKITDTIPKMTGYNFNAWTTVKLAIGDPNHNGHYHYYPTSMCSNEDKGTRDYYHNIKSNVTLYAEWMPINYTIRFHINDGGTDQTSEQPFKYNEAKNLTSASSMFTRENYTFISWNTKPDGSGTTYQDQQSVKNLTSTEGAVIELYAQWKINNSLTVKLTNAYSGDYTSNNSKRIEFLPTDPGILDITLTGNVSEVYVEFPTELQNASTNFPVEGTTPGWENVQNQYAEVHKDGDKSTAQIKFNIPTNLKSAIPPSTTNYPEIVNGQQVVYYYFEVKVTAKFADAAPGQPTELEATRKFKVTFDDVSYRFKTVIVG